MGPMSNPASSETGRFKPSPDVVFRRVGEEAVLVPLSQNVGNLDWVYTLSPVAALPSPAQPALIRCAIPAGPSCSPAALAFATARLAN